MKFIEETLEEVAGKSLKLSKGPMDHMRRWCRPPDWQMRRPIDGDISEDNDEDIADLLNEQ